MENDQQQQQQQQPPPPVHPEQFKKRDGMLKREAKLERLKNEQCQLEKLSKAAHK